MDEAALLSRITVNPKIFGGKPIIRGHRLAVEHVLGMLAAGSTPEEILDLNDKYCIKHLFIEDGKRLSQQYHERKMETLILVSGALLRWAR